jgi:hypothetical protein
LGAELGSRKCCVEAEEGVQPLFHSVALCVTNWLGKGDFFQRASALHTRLLGGPPARTVNLDGTTRTRSSLCPGLFSELLDELERQRTSGSFVSTDCGRHEDEIGAHQLAHKGYQDSQPSSSQVRLDQVFIRSGMAAASSITTSSAWPRVWLSWGRIYWMVCRWFL